MSPGSIGLALFSALVPSVWANTTEPDYNLSTVATSGGSSENIETYSVEEESSSPFMTDIGTGILARLAHPPYDSSLLEEAVATPTYDAVKENITYNEQSVGSFLTFLWAAMVFFCIITVVNTLQRCVVCCTGEYRHRVTSSYMAFFVFLFVVLIILFMLMTVLLVSLVSTRDSMVDSVREKVPAVVASTFQGLRGFVNLTVAQIAQNRRTARMPQVGHVLGDGFDTAFKSFVASSAMADVRIPLHHVSQECTSNLQYLGRMANTGGYSRLEAKLRVMRDQCAHLRRYQEQLFEDVSNAVTTATRKDRQKVFQVLSDYASMMDESDCNVVPSHNSINQLEKELNAFEDSKGAFKSLANYVESDLFWVVILHALSLCLLVVGLLMGICTHDRNIEPHERSGLSHLVGCELTLTAYAFTLFVIVGIIKSMFMTIESTLGYTYFCEPYLSNNYVILDDALERLWPASNRSHLLSRIVPSEVMENCQNESISILDLGPKPSHGRTSRRQGVFLPRLNLKIVLQELSSQPERERAKDSFSHTADVFLNAIPSFQNALSAEAKFLNGNRANATSFLNKWSDFWNKDSDPMVNKTVIKKVLLPMIPSYYNHFVTDLVSIAMQPTGNTVAGRCSLLRAILKSFMDVVCYTYVLEFIGYWASLLLAVFLAIMVIPFCFMLAKYFFCTQRLIRVLRRPRKSRKGMPAHSLSESLEREQTPEQYGGRQVHPLTRLLQMYAGSELPPGTTRRIVAMSTKNTSLLPTLGPPIHQMASFSSRVTQTPKRLHAVHSSTSIIATGGGVVTGIPAAVVAAQPATPSMLHGHLVAAPAGHVASASVHRADSLTLVQPHYHSHICTNLASSSHQSLVQPVQAPLMYGAPVPVALPQSQPSFVAQPMSVSCCFLCI
ncbi:hypothetical protein HPB49_016223 [Dermacentor silvarum]|uniref:Uncharacterized protein n=1 Tax=Dermacentor silvarum TaxID=543639 RepID=A0ACB8E284_DERSI|nr:hypothetical protein HPB49_016223 [Dermacentor silvarum]